MKYLKHKLKQMKIYKIKRYKIMNFTIDGE